MKHISCLKLLRNRLKGRLKLFLINSRQGTTLDATLAFVYDLFLLLNKLRRFCDLLANRLSGTFILDYRKTRRKLGIDKRGQQRIRYNLLHRRRNAVPGMVRVSFGLYNTQDEIDRLIEALKAISRGEHGKYEVDSATGFYTPVDVAEDTPRYFKI